MASIICEPIFVGWPVGFERRMFHSTPVLYDMDSDGIQDIVVADSNARVLWLRLGDYGTYLHDIELRVPRLKVRRNWSVLDTQKF